MSILNRPSDGLPSVLVALWRTLLSYGPQADDRLLELCAPTSVVPDGKPDMARKTLTRWTQLGFFSQSDGTVHLDARLADIPIDDLDGLRAAVLRLVVAPENNPALNSAPGEDHEGSMASDYTRAGAWVLAQDPYAFPTSYRGVESLQGDQRVNPKPFTNDTRWVGFVDWATFLGIGWKAAKLGFVPEPSFALRAVADDVFVGATELPQESFFARLADALPILDGGRYRVAVDSGTARAWRTFRQNEISPCLSATLLTLEARGDIRLEERSDAPQKTLLGRGGRDLRRVTHVVRVGQV